MNWKRWDIRHRRWQDVVAFLAGMWLIATVMAQLSTVSFAGGWLAFLAGALIVLMSAGGLQDEGATYSWVAAFGGLLAVGAAFVAFTAGQMGAFWSLLIAGAVVLFVEVWAATLKQRARLMTTERTKARAGRTVRA